MKRNLLGIALSLPLLLNAVAQAQTTQLKVTVPFEFTAGNVALPAGLYEITSAGSWGGSTLLIRNVNSNAGSFLVSFACSSKKPVANAKLVFHRYDQQYFLAEVWNRHSSLGNQMPVNSRQTQLARNQSRDEVVLMASEK